MKKYRKKPVVIEAIQFDGSRQMTESLKSAGVFCGYIISHDHATMQDSCIGNIKTLEGTMQVKKDDWIIKGIKGEYYPCRSDIFEATYDEVVDNSDDDLFRVQPE